MTFYGARQWFLRAALAVGWLAAVLAARPVAAQIADVEAAARPAATQHTTTAAEAEAGIKQAEAIAAPSSGEVAATPAAAVTAQATATQAAATQQATANENYKRIQRFSVQFALLALVVVGALTGIALARRGKALPIRDIPGLMVFEEAVARATEMGRPTFFTCGGTCEIRRVQLYASMPLLRHVSSLSAKLGNRLIVAVGFPETLPVHMNAVRDGYLQADALEAFHSDDVRYFPGGQFFFAMAAMGFMLEQRPATCFYFGWWEADSLMFAETGQTINAMQIAGTDELYQIPFFVAACDYTLIGEEFWAASAKISQDPQLLGSLGAQDVFKLGLLVLIVGGVLVCFIPQFASWMDALRGTFG